MGVSKIEICNVALAMLGADSIRSFDEKNKRARMADVFFDFTRDYLLSKFDWPFAKKLAKLQPLNVEAMELTVPDGFFAYQLPHECHAARDIDPPGSKDPWDVMGDVLYCQIDPESNREVRLYYTALIEDVTKYSSSFNNLLALGLAVKMCAPVTQDKALQQALTEQFNAEQLNTWEANANVGDLYREHDEDPNNDSFVYPEGAIPIDDTWR